MEGTRAAQCQGNDQVLIFVRSVATTDRQHIPLKRLHDFPLRRLKQYSYRIFPVRSVATTDRQHLPLKRLHDNHNRRLKQ